MAETVNKNIRIFFSKTGRAIYISHLDLYRLFQRSIKRAKLPVWETEGFNPHLYLTFALPLALGTAGVCESMDTKLTEVRKPTEIAVSEYEADFECDDAAFDAFLAAEHIPAEKKTKRGIAELDLKQHLTVLERRPGYLRFTLPSGTELNINAGLMFDAFEKISGTEIYSLHVTRTAVKCSDGEIFR